MTRFEHSIDRTRMFMSSVALIWRFSSCENSICNDVTITSSLRSVVHVLMGHFTIFSVTRIVRMSHAKHYEKLSKFVKVTAKILSVPFFRTRCGHTQ